VKLWPQRIACSLAVAFRYQSRDESLAFRVTCPKKLEQVRVRERFMNVIVRGGTLHDVVGDLPKPWLYLLRRSRSKPIHRQQKGVEY
jgi:hypothetical protein